MPAKVKRKYARRDERLLDQMYGAVGGELILTLCWRPIVFFFLHRNRISFWERRTASEFCIDEVGVLIEEYESPESRI